MLLPLGGLSRHFANYASYHLQGLDCRRICGWIVCMWAHELQSMNVNRNVRYLRFFHHFEFSDIATSCWTLQIHQTTHKRQCTIQTSLPGTAFDPRSLAKSVSHKQWPVPLWLEIGRLNFGLSETDRKCRKFLILIVTSHVQCLLYHECRSLRVHCT